MSWKGKDFQAGFRVLAEANGGWLLVLRVRVARHMALVCFPSYSVCRSSPGPKGFRVQDLSVGRSGGGLP